MKPHPGRISDDDVEAAADADVGKVRAEREGKRSTSSKRSLVRALCARLRAKSRQPNARRAVDQCASSEKIARADSSENVPTRGGRALDRVSRREQRKATLLAFQGTRERDLSMPDGGRVPPPHSGEPCAAGKRLSRREVTAGERVADENVVIEIRQR